MPTVEEAITIAKERYEAQRKVVEGKSAAVQQMQNQFEEARRDLNMETVQLAALSKAVETLEEINEPLAEE